MRSEGSTLISTKFQASTYRYLVVQTVTQKTTLSVSYKSKLAFDSHINGSARGLVYMLSGGESKIHTYLTSANAANNSVTSQVIAVPFLRRGIFNTFH